MEARVNVLRFLSELEINPYLNILSGVIFYIPANFSALSVCTTSW